MRYFYSKDQLHYLRQKKRRLIGLGSFIVILTLVISIALCFIVNDVNAEVIKHINILLCSFAGCAVLYLWLELISPLRARISYTGKVLQDTQEHITGTVTSIEREFTLRRHIKVIELEFCTDDQLHRMLYLDTDEQYSSLIGKRIALSVVSNLIVGYEVLE